MEVLSTTWVTDIKVEDKSDERFQIAHVSVSRIMPKRNQDDNPKTKFPSRIFLAQANLHANGHATGLGNGPIRTLLWPIATAFKCLMRYR